MEKDDFKRLFMQGFLSMEPMLTKEYTGHKTKFYSKTQILILLEEMEKYCDNPEQDSQKEEK